jgi:ketosteroid isomerase-like protein
MKTRMLVLAVVLILAAGWTLNAQTATKGTAVAEELKAQMQTILDAWSTLDISKVAPYYDTESRHAFYDVAPLKYTGWKEYAAGSEKMFAGLNSLKFTLANDVQTQRRGDMAWGTATFQTVLTQKDGKAETVEGRWTAIWEKRGGKWLVVHEHVSAPAPMPPQGE